MNNNTPGAVYLGGGRCRFTVWAPRAQKVGVYLMAPQERKVELKPQGEGYFSHILEGVAPGSQYFYILDGDQERPDPASRYQPEGVAGPSQVVDPAAFPWTDCHWRGAAREKLVFYELHVGTFTPEGTFEAIISYLEDLCDLGITAIELMPAAQFPGTRNWGYDGAYPFAVQNSYGGPAGLQRLVDACHRRGLAVFLDVVYNHLGPEGNYLDDFGPYFTDRYHTPWGRAVNFDGPGSDAVRHFFIANALYWLTEFHLDGLRLDAVHAILDFSAYPFPAELAQAVQQTGEKLGRRVHIIAESDLNDPRIIYPPVVGGYGLDAQWNDDFHHALHVLLTGENQGYYQDFKGGEDLGRAFQHGYVYTGQYSRYRRRRHGRQPRWCTGSQFIVFAQNHDQVGNRARGERLAALTSLAGQKLAAAAVIFSPFLPLIFMGEEYAETAPFLYFTSHTDPRLADAVCKGRQQEFAAFAWEQEAPDPQDPATFQQSRLQQKLRHHGHHRTLYSFYRRLLQLRRQLPALASLNLENLEVTTCPRDVVLLHRRAGDDEVVVILGFRRAPATVTLPLEAGAWRKMLDSAEIIWGGPGSNLPSVLSSTGEATVTLPPQTCVLLQRTKEALV